MNTLTKLALGLIGQVRPQPLAEGAERRALPAPRLDAGLPLMQALARRESQREFSPKPIDDALLSDLLWATAGVNRPEAGGRTAPSAMNAQEVMLFVATADGLYAYEPTDHSLRRAAAADVRAVTGHQDFVDTAPLDLIYVADHSRLSLVPAAQRQAYAYVAAGAMAQNAYLACASAGLATVLRAWFDRDALGKAMGLGNDHALLLCQTVGWPAHATAHHR